jgi:serine kinase of HPr protein (carbohydrate metabolism regulator)
MTMKYLPRTKDTTKYSVQIPEVVLPVSPGKDISSLSEVIAMNLMLNVYGEKPSNTMPIRVRQWTERMKRLREYLKRDDE